MHPKYWKFPGAVYRNADNGDGNQNPGGAPSGEPSEADKAAAEKAAADKVAADAAAAKAGEKKPSDEEAKLLKEVMQKKDALKAREAELASAQERLKAFEGIDPDAVKKLLAEQKAAEEAQLAAKGEFETLKQRMADEHTRVTREKDELIAQLQAQLQSKDKVVDELSIGQHFAQSKFITEESTMAPAKARKLFGDHFDVVDGKVVAYDRPRGEAGRVQMVDQIGNPIPFEDAMRKIVEADPDKDSLLRSKVKPGAGSESKTTPKGINSQQPKQLDSVSKITQGLNLAKLLDEKQP